jgi:hypothetical protein
VPLLLSENPVINLVVETTVNFHAHMESKTAQLFKNIKGYNYLQTLYNLKSDSQKEIVDFSEGINLSKQPIFCLVTNGSKENFKQIQKFLSITHPDHIMQEAKDFVFKKNPFFFIYLKDMVEEERVERAHDTELQLLKDEMIQINNTMREELSSLRQEICKYSN